MIVDRAARLAMLLVAAIGCGGHAHDGGSRGPRVRGSARVGGRVVATVDGVGITVAEAARASGETGRALRESVRLLEDEQLLAAEAQRRGLGRDRAVRIATDQALVQALLVREVEAAVPESSVTVEEIATAYEAQRARFRRPERRASVHVLARVPPGAEASVDARARDVVVRAIAAIRASADHQAAALAWQPPEGLAFEIRQEQVPAISRDADAAEPYKAALFAARGPGLWPEPVRTVYGWHAIVITQIEPARSDSLEDASPELRREIAIRRRAVRLEELIREIAGRELLERDERAIAAAVARDPETGGP